VRLIISAFVAASLLIATVAAPAAAYTRKSADGTFLFTTNRVTTTTLRDKTPRRAKAVVFLQKKAGPTKCRVNSIRFTRAGRTYNTGPLEKWARTRDRAGVWVFPGTRYDRTIAVTVRTNGRCIVGVGII
jgi:hypothetical protein